MCILAFALQASPAYPFILLFNRDESFARATLPLHLWGEEGIAAGCDGMNGGTWLGVGRDGTVCALTNYWEDLETEATFNAAPSVAAGVVASDGFLTRGAVPLRMLRCRGNYEEVVSHLQTHQQAYKSFNLIYANVHSPWAAHLSLTRKGFSEPIQYSSGVHCISNGAIDSDWDKVTRLSTALRGYLGEGGRGVSVEGLLSLLGDRQTGRKCVEGMNDQDTAVFVERHLDTNFGRVEPLGTVSSTVVLCDREGKLTVVERTYEQDQAQFHDSTVTIDLPPPNFLPS